MLYISTANGDDRIKIFYFTAKYESAGCRVTTLAFFISPFPNANHVSSLFEQADIIYVPGGNTRAMLAIWRGFAVVDHVKRAWENGKVLCGVSAGAICWFEHGHSDSGGVAETLLVNTSEDLASVQALASHLAFNRAQRGSRDLPNGGSYSASGK